MGDRSTYNSVQSHCEQSNGHWCPGNARLYEQVTVDAEPHSAILSHASSTTAMLAGVAALLSLVALFVVIRRRGNSTLVFERAGTYGNLEHGHFEKGQPENGEGSA